MWKFKSLLLKTSVKRKNRHSLFKKSYLFHKFALPSWVPKPVSGFKFAVKMALYHDVSQLVCDVNHLAGLFTAGLTNIGLTIGLFTGRITLSELNLLRNVEIWSNVFTPQDFKSTFGHFSTLYRKGLDHLLLKLHEQFFLLLVVMERPGFYKNFAWKMLEQKDFRFDTRLSSTSFFLKGIWTCFYFCTGK